jgi:hypothetical protein
MNSRRRVNSDVMLLSFEHQCGSRLNYNLLHAAIRISNLITVALMFLIIFSGHVENVAIHNFVIYPLLCAPIGILLVVIFESVRLRRNQIAQRAVAIDWLFMIASLAVWCVEIFRMLTTFG